MNCWKGGSCIHRSDYLMSFSNGRPHDKKRGCGLDPDSLHVRLRFTSKCNTLYKAEWRARMLKLSLCKYPSESRRAISSTRFHSHQQDSYRLRTILARMLVNNSSLQLVLQRKIGTQMECASDHLIRITKWLLTQLIIILITIIACTKLLHRSLSILNSTHVRSKGKGTISTCTEIHATYVRNSLLFAINIASVQNLVILRELSNT
ncbi:unnamed protein product [Albugo candida]|uniref:Uncharacterized protein n=1 Tax=Albugo candida TaxID=65357 RepID=A0A024FTX7_9STRA|nr:unnamed protein product [Albugo candida]|eukprot:CCI10119.1 unnamed protein product [Albugo candida]